MSFDNFVQSTLTVGIDATSSVMTLASAISPYRLPPTDGGVLVLADSLGRPTFVEVVSYSARTGNNLTGVARGLEGTTARAWGNGTVVYQPLTSSGYQAGLDSKEPVIANGTAIQYWKGNKSWADLATDVRATVLTGLSVATNQAINATDTVLSALGKIQKQVNDAATNLSSLVRTTVLSSYSVGSNAVLNTTDTVVGAFGKLQAQINGLMTNSKPTVLNTPATLVINTAAHLNAAGAYSLPVTAGLVAGDRITLTKAGALSPTVQVTGGVTITINSKSDTGFIFNLPAEVTVVWNGAGWEV